MQVTLEVDADGADASGYEPIWKGAERIGFVTSGGFGHTTGKSLAMALVDTAHSAEGSDLTVHIVGVERAAKVIAASPYDPTGKAMRGCANTAPADEDAAHRLPKHGQRITAPCATRFRR